MYVIDKPTPLQRNFSLSFTSRNCHTKFRHFEFTLFQKKIKSNNFFNSNKKFKFQKSFSFSDWFTIKFLIPNVNKYTKRYKYKCFLIKSSWNQIKRDLNDYNIPLETEVKPIRSNNFLFQFFLKFLVYFLVVCSRFRLRLRPQHNKHKIKSFFSVLE